MQSRSHSLLIVALLIAVIGWRLQDFFDVGMASQDQIDFSTALGQEHGLWQEVLGHAQAQGRLYFVLTKFIDLVAASYTTHPLIQIANLALFAGVPWLIAWLTFEDRRDQVVFLLAYWALCTLGWNHTTPAAYPLVLTVPLMLVGMAAGMAARHSRSPTRLTLAAYGCLAFAALFQYEPGTLVAAVLLVWFIRSRTADRRQRRQLYIATAIPLGLYAIAYLTWRTIHPSLYATTTEFGLSLAAVVRVLVVYALGALPRPPHGNPDVTIGDLTTGQQILPYPGFGIRSSVFELVWMDIIVAIVASGLLWFVLADRSAPSRAERPGATTLAGVFGLGFMLLLAANILVAISRKYQLWAESSWSTAYLTSYYALFGWVVLITGASNRLSPAWARVGAVAAFSAVFLYASGSNHFAGKQIRANFSKWQTMDALTACQDHLASYDAFVLPAAFYGVFGQRGDWSGYWHQWTRTTFGSPLKIAPNDAGMAMARAARVKPLLDDGGALKAVVGHGRSRGFLIFRKDRPNYLWLRHAASMDGTEAGELVVVDRAETSRCRRGYRVVALTASVPIDSVDVHWHLPGIPIRSASIDVLPLSSVAGSHVTRVVQALYLGYLRRPADPGGLQFWSDRIRGTGGRTFDVVATFSEWPAWTESVRRTTDFNDLVTESYRILMGRQPRSDETQRMSAFASEARHRALVPWLVIADLLQSGNPEFANRLQLAQHYTENVHSGSGWRADVWERSVKLISSEPASLQQAITSLRD